MSIAKEHVLVEISYQDVTLNSHKESVVHVDLFISSNLFVLVQHRKRRQITNRKIYRRQRPAGIIHI